MNDSRIFFNLWLLAAAANACSQGTVSIGAQQTTLTKTGLAAYAANWNGYIEAYQFMDGTDTVRISVADDGTGTIRFGNAALWPVASDPDAAYPPDYPNGAGVSGGMPLPLAWDGFLFKLNSLRVETERLRASVASQTVFESWCTLQKPISIGSNAYACVDSSVWIVGYGPTFGNGYTDQDGGVDSSACAAYTAALVSVAPGQFATVKVPCEQSALCTASTSGGTSGSLSSVVICECTESACQLASIQDDIVLDVALDTEQMNMVGTLALGTSNYTIRLKRQ